MTTMDDGEITARARHKDLISNVVSDLSWTEIRSHGHTIAHVTIK